MLLRIKTVGLKTEDFIIGERNGILLNRNSSLSMNVLGTDNFDSQEIPDSSNNQSLNIFKVPLKYLFESPYTPQQSVSDPNLKLWNDYFELHGKDSCMIKNTKVLRELLVKTCGVPTALRGDFWMISSGAWSTRPDNNYYTKNLNENSGSINPFAEEIEKDVPRSLPEHHAYQTKAGLDALRRILVSYSFRNPGIGYAQALNIISAILLLHLREEDAFWLLCTIVEKILPDHYTKTLVGSVVDQQVFTHTVGLFMPALTAHMTKYYMELSTFTVPWFVCIYLNTLSLKINSITLDAFFLDGPKFLHWFGLAILKLNEKKLLIKKDDEVFMNVFKNFYSRLADDSNDLESDEDSIYEGTLNDEMFEKLKGKSLMQYTLWTTYTNFAPHFTTELFESLRLKFMLKVVHEMEQSYQKSQIRTICESVKLSFEEVEIVYNQVRQLEFLRDEENDTRDRALTNCLIDWVSERGGWGCKTIKKKSKPESQKHNKNIIKKAILLKEFRIIFQKISPWRETTLIQKKEKQRQSNTGLSFRRPSLVISVVKQLLPEDYQLSITDRLFFYTAFHQKTTTDQTELMVDLGDITMILDTLYKQPLQVKLRLLFDLHDIDGDGILNKYELKALMDSLLEIFDKIKEKVAGCAKEEELYLRAVSAFLGIALKSGKSGEQDEKVGKTRGASAQVVDDRGRSRGPSANLLNEEKSTRSRHKSTTSGDDTYRLGFHEFLLSIMSQSVFVEYFERIWSVSQDELGRIILNA